MQPTHTIGRTTQCNEMVKHDSESQESDAGLHVESVFVTLGLYEVDLNKRGGRARVVLVQLLLYVG